MSEETLEISFDEIEKEREKYLLVDTRDKVTVEYGMIPGAISVPEQELEERETAVLQKERMLYGDND